MNVTLNKYRVKKYSIYFITLIDRHWKSKKLFLFYQPIDPNFSYDPSVEQLIKLA